MTRKELDWILSKVSDFMMSAKVDGKKIFDVTAFSSAKNYKVAVRFFYGEKKNDFIVVDYNEESELRDCQVKQEEKSLTLDCDNPEKRDGLIEYKTDEELTFKIHKHLSSYLEM